MGTAPLAEPPVGGPAVVAAEDAGGGRAAAVEREQFGPGGRKLPGTVDGVDAVSESTVDAGADAGDCAQPASEEGASRLDPVSLPATSDEGFGDASQASGAARAEMSDALEFARLAAERGQTQHHLAIALKERHVAEQALAEAMSRDLSRVIQRESIQRALEEAVARVRDPESSTKQVRCRAGLCSSSRRHCPPTPSTLYQAHSHPTRLPFCRSLS